MNTCKYCGKSCKRTYCNQQCQNDYQYQQHIIAWQNGELNGMRGKTSTANWLKRYIIGKYGNKCCKCGWCEVNPKTGKIPVELEHIDGNFTNNKEDNLILLCPNCHSLTETYKSLNNGKGRPCRTIK